MLNRTKRVHAKFLESCRSLTDGRGYWDNAGPLRKWFAQLITPVPLLALDDEGKRLYDALLWLEANCRRTPLSEDVVRRYHRMLAPKSPEPPGEYRRGPIVMEMSSHVCPPAARVPALMRRYGEELQECLSELDGLLSPGGDEVLRTAVDFHRRLVEIHPFADANGRVARLLMNHLLRRYAQPYVILPPMSECQEHFDALQEAHAGKPELLLALCRKHRHEA